MARHFSVPLTERQVELRQRWAEHLCTPAMEVRDGGRWIVEEFVQGDHLHEVDSRTQTEVVRAMIRGYADLVRACGEGCCREELEMLGRRISSLSRPGDLLWGTLKDPSFLRGNGVIPRVPTKWRFVAANVIVTEGGQPVFIDAMPLALEPFFLMPLTSLFHWWAKSPHLRETYMAGGFDPQLHELFAEAGVAYNGTADERSDLLAICVALGAARRVGDVATVDGAAFDEAATSFLRRCGMVSLR